MNKIQNHIYQIFIEFDKACKKMGLKYFALGGTALGAERHSGFIPWDDDMDFGMTRNDYEKFIRDGQKYLPKNLFIQCHKTDSEWFEPFMKIRDQRIIAIESSYRNCNFNQGIWIDIFPIDGNIKKRLRNKIDSFYQRVLLKRITLGLYRTNHHHLAEFALKIIFPSKELAYQMLEKSLKKYNRKKNIKYGCTPVAIPDRYCNSFPLSLLEKTKIVKFETTKMVVFKNNVDYLVQKYGNWNEIPTAEKRKSGHTIIKLIENKEN